MPYVEVLRRDLAAAGQAAPDDVREAAERLSYAVEPSLRLALLDALGTAAAEVTAQLSNAVVEVRLRGRDPELVVSEAVEHVPSPPLPLPPPAPGDVDEGLSRISFRLQESLKSRVETAAAAEGLSVNAWLVRAVAQMLDGPTRTTTIRGGRHLSGWVR